MAIERYQVKNKKSYSFITYICGLIFLISFLQFDYIILLQTAIIAFATALVFQLYKMYEHGKFNRSTVGLLKGKNKPSIFDSFFLSRKYFSINKKYIFASTIGLILAIMVISQQVLLTTSYQQNAYDMYLEGNDTSALRFEIFRMNDAVFDDWNTLTEQQLQTWITSPKLQITNYFNEGNLKFRILLGHTFNFDARSRYAHTTNIETHQWNEFYFDFYSKFPTFPNMEFNGSESLLILPPNLQQTTIGVGTFYYELNNFTQEVDGKPNIPILVNSDVIGGIVNASIPWNFNNFTYPVDKVWQLAPEDIAYVYSGEIQLPDGIELGSLYLPKGQEWELFDELQEKVEEFDQPDYIWGLPGFTTLVSIKQPLLTDMSLSELNFILDDSILRTKSKVDEFVAAHGAFIIGHSYGAPFQLSSPLSTLSHQFEDGLQGLTKSMRFSSTPLLLISLALLFFSLSLIEKRKERLFSMMISRGTSIAQIRVMIIYELIVSSIFASIIGMAISYPVSKLFLKSSGILEFNANSIPIIIPATWWIKTPIFGFLLALLFNSFSLYNVARLEIEYTMEVANSKAPVWQRLNLDIILFFSSLIFWFIILFVPISESSSKFLFSSYGKIVLVLTIIGFPWVVGRYFIGTLSRLLLVLKLRFDTISLAIRNIDTHKHFTAQLIAILMIGMMLSFMGLVTSETMSSISEERSLYGLGAEIVIENIDYTNPTVQTSLNVPGVESTSFVRYIMYKPGVLDVPSGENPDNWPITYFFGIDVETFAHTAFWKDNYAENTLEEIVKSLNQSENGMIMENEYAKAYNLEVGDQYLFRYSSYAQISFPFNLSATVKYFPRAITSIPAENQFGFHDKEDIVIITTLQNLANISVSLVQDEDMQMVYVKTDNTPVRQVVDALNSALLPLTVTEFTIRDYSSETGSFFEGDNPTSKLVEQEIKFINLSVHTILIFTFIITMIGISYYSFIFIGDRQKEIGIYRALGMTKRQIQKLLFYEISMMIMISIVSGLIAGYFLSYVSFIVLFNNSLTPIPPFHLYPPYRIIVQFSAVITLAGLLIAFIPSWQHTRKQTGNILREG